ncbi:hypothetical protein ES703_29411 [subsurface metagenome]
MKKLIIITISISLLLGFWQTVQAIDLLLDYPDIPGAGKIEEASTLPEIIRYIYMFALGAAGFVALLAILIGAIMYIFSAGKPDKAKDAKDQIMSALLGILILLASVLILRTINPDLVNMEFELPIITPIATSAYPYTQCHLSNFNLCSSGENLYRSCIQSFTTNPGEATETCMESCQNLAIQLGDGIPHCTVYNNQSQCQPTGCH